jgi:hypothetical protein
MVAENDSHKIADGEKVNSLLERSHAGVNSNQSTVAFDDQLPHCAGLSVHCGEERFATRAVRDRNSSPGCQGFVTALNM